MDISYAILGLLSWRSFTGYDLKKIISESDLFYWSGNNNQIYNSLVDLHKAGLVTQQVQYQESLPAKKIYTITEKGQAELNSRAGCEPELPEMHNHFLIQLSWTEGLSDEAVDGLLAKYEAELEVQLRMRQVQAGKPGLAPDRSPRERYVWAEISANLIAAYEHELDWVRQVRKNLQAMGSQARPGEDKAGQSA